LERRIFTAVMQTLLARQTRECLSKFAFLCWIQSNVGVLHCKAKCGVSLWIPDAAHSEWMTCSVGQAAHKQLQEVRSAGKLIIRFVTLLVASARSMPIYIILFPWKRTYIIVVFSVTKWVGSSNKSPC
jgi:hypothetical protein